VTTRPLRILYVEDHHDTAVALGKLLSQLGHEVRVATTAGEAMRLCEHERFDLLICDLKLPDGDCLGLLTHARKFNQSVKGIILSGCGMPEDVAKSKTAGFEAHLIKPIAFGALIDTLHSVMHDQTPSAPSSDSTMPTGVTFL
jgi:CheY-like chemotaxis protein